MPELPRKPPKQYAPVKFGEPFNPKSVEGHHWKLRQAAAIRYRREREELAVYEAAEAARRSAPSWISRLWNRFRGR